MLKPPWVSWQSKKFVLVLCRFVRIHILLLQPAGFSLRAFKRGSQGLRLWSKGALDYDSVVSCFKEAKTTCTAKVLIILDF